MRGTDEDDAGSFITMSGILVGAWAYRRERQSNTVAWSWGLLDWVIQLML
jgi:hypothetical protein